MACLAALAPVVAFGVFTACQPTGNSSPGTDASTANDSATDTGRPPSDASPEAAQLDSSGENDLNANGPFGGLATPEEALLLIKALPPRAFTIPSEAPPTLPSSATLTNLPSIATQGTVPKPLGSPGTCEAQSFAYGLGSYTAARDPDGGILWSATTAANQVSAAWMFDWMVSQSLATCPKGGKAFRYLDRLVLVGAPSAADRPYEPSCPYLTDASVLSEVYGDESHLQIGGYATFLISKATGMPPTGLPNRAIHEFVSAGQAVAFSGPIIQGYINPKHQPTLDSGVFYGDGATEAGHGQLVVGYDDTIGTTANPGAFLIQNSFGPQWGDGGRVYFAYDTFLKTQVLAAVAWPINPGATGTALAPTGFDGGTPPAASLVRGFQWAPSDANVFLVVIHHFDEPVTMTSVAFTEPSATAPGKTATATLSTAIRDFYTYIQRTDGNSFVEGTYSITLQVQTIAGIAGSYTGTIAVGAPAPSTPRAATMASAIWGPTGAAATVTGP
jgi:hypothetical protein